MVADDEKEMLALLVATLEARGFAVTQATNGVELLEHLADDEHFDLVVTDVAMPWGSGVQIMASTRYAGMLDVPVIVITGLTSPEIPAQVQRLGRTVLLRKPFAIAALQAAVDDALRENPVVEVG
jgi:DNA-binding response OmpR family regulator